MGKVKNTKKPSKRIGIRKKNSALKNEKKNSTQNPPEEPDKGFTSSITESFRKDSDVMSVRSMKSIKNKFGIKKQISKQDKLKLKKEVLKQKVDFLMDSVNSKKSSYKVGSKSDKLTITVKSKTEFVQDKDEEYLKLGKKTKGIPKRKKRKEQMIKDTNLLKNLMFKKKKPIA